MRWRNLEPYGETVTNVPVLYVLGEQPMKQLWGKAVTIMLVYILIVISCQFMTTTGCDTRIIRAMRHGCECDFLPYIGDGEN